MKNNIILTGYMGCGKTTLGKKLSYKERIALLDTDKMIEQKNKMSISEIFDKYGEPRFREMETEVLKEIMTYKQRYVISVGGGLPMKEENRKLLKELGVVIYLKATPDTIYDRLKNDTSRPLLRSENPRKRIEEMIEMRNPMYMDGADAIINVDRKGYEEILTEIRNVKKVDR